MLCEKNILNVDSCSMFDLIITVWSNKQTTKYNSILLRLYYFEIHRIIMCLTYCIVYSFIG